MGVSQQWLVKKSGVNENKRSLLGKKHKSKGTNIKENYKSIERN
jgi:hypothetical protein